MKKRQICKLFSLMLALAMLASLAIPAFAADEDESEPLWFVWLDEDWESGDRELYLNTREAGGTEYFELQIGYPAFGILGTGDCRREDGSFDLNKFTPVDPSKVTVPSGLTISTDVTPQKGAKWGQYYFELSTTVRDQRFQITSGKAALTVDTSLPSDLSVYTAPKASWANWAGRWGFPYNQAKDNVFYLLSTATDEAHGRHLTGVALTGWQENKLVTMSKVSDGIYKVELKPEALTRYNFHLEVDITWANAEGDSWTDKDCYIGNFDSWRPILASETALMDGTAEEGPDLTAYPTVKDKLSSSVSMKPGEAKTLYLYTMGLMDEGEDWQVFYYSSHNLYYSSGKGLTVAGDEADPSKYTLTASEPGNYEIFLGYREIIGLYHADGSAYTKAEWDKFMNDIAWYINGEEMTVCDDWTEETTLSDFVPFEELFPGERYVLSEVQEADAINLTVTVEAEFTDVKASDYFADPVAWALKSGITNGTSTTKFSPEDKCTQVQILTFLYRAARGEVDPKAAPTAADMDEAVKWAKEKGMIDDSFEAGKFCTRSTAVRYIWQAFGSPEAEPVSFSDVDAGADYAAAVSWALEKKVTNGTSIENNIFGPGEVCSRGQIVTFLYRAYAD